MAFHEAFADLVPFQHFWPSDALRAQIAQVRGDLHQRVRSGRGPQFGQAIGRLDVIRNALGKTTRRPHPRRPDPKAYKDVDEPHDRGDILVGAVFDAFTKLYESRVGDLRRIATRGSGILAEGTLHPDLVDRFTREASLSAQRVLTMCIRALDYMPPVEITFGDYLRAIITADYDLEPASGSYDRVAFLDAFRRYGIFPRDVGTLSVETLLWPGPAKEADVASLGTFVTELSREQAHWSLPRDRSTVPAPRRREARLHKHLSLGKGPRAGRRRIDLKKPSRSSRFTRERPRPQPRHAVRGVDRQDRPAARGHDVRHGTIVAGGEARERRKPFRQGGWLHAARRRGFGAGAVSHRAGHRRQVHEGRAAGRSARARRHGHGGAAARRAPAARLCLRPQFGREARNVRHQRSRALS
jgi:hypothetical protein